MKKASLATRIAIAGAETLKRSLRSDRLPPLNQNDMTSTSRTTVIVPADGPNSNTDVKTNVSETESLADSDGTFTVKEPVNRAKPARTNQSAPRGFADNRQTN